LHVQIPIVPSSNGSSFSFWAFFLLDFFLGAGSTLRANSIGGGAAKEEQEEAWSYFLLSLPAIHRLVLQRHRRRSRQLRIKVFVRLIPFHFGWWWPQRLRGGHRNSVMGGGEETALIGGGSAGLVLLSTETGALAVTPANLCLSVLWHIFFSLQIGVYPTFRLSQHRWAESPNV